MRRVARLPLQNRGPGAHRATARARNGGRATVLDWSVPIKAFTGSCFNHAAVAYVEPDTRQVLFWEINGAGTRLATVRDLTCGRPDHDVFVRSLSAPIDVALFERAMAAQWEHEFTFPHRPPSPPAPLDTVARGSRSSPPTPPRHSQPPCSTATSCTRASPRVRRRPPREAAPRSKRTCAHMVAELYHLVGVLDYDGGRRGIDPAAVFAGDFGREGRGAGHRDPAAHRRDAWPGHHRDCRTHGRHRNEAGGAGLHCRLRSSSNRSDGADVSRGPEPGARMRRATGAGFGTAAADVGWVGDQGRTQISKSRPGARATGTVETR